MRWVMSAVAVVMFASTAHARQDVPVEVSGAAGYANALHGDLDFGAPAVSGTVRVRVSPHLALEGQVGCATSRARRRDSRPR